MSGYKSIGSHSLGQLTELQQALAPVGRLGVQVKPASGTLLLETGTGGFPTVGVIKLASGEVVHTLPNVNICAKTLFEIKKWEDIGKQATKKISVQQGRIAKWEKAKAKALNTIKLFQMLAIKEKAILAGKKWPGDNATYIEYDNKIIQAELETGSVAKTQWAGKVYTFWAYVWKHRVALGLVIPTGTYGTGPTGAVQSFGSGMNSPNAIMAARAAFKEMKSAGNLPKDWIASSYSAKLFAPDFFVSGSDLKCLSTWKYPVADKYSYTSADDYWAKKKAGKPVRTRFEQCMWEDYQKSESDYYTLLGLAAVPQQVYDLAVAKLKTAKKVLDDANKLQASATKKAFALAATFHKQCKVLIDQCVSCKQFIDDKSDLLFLHWKGLVASKQAAALAKMADEDSSVSGKLADETTKLAALVKKLQEKCNAGDKAACGALTTAQAALKAKGYRAGNVRNEVAGDRAMSGGKTKESDKDLKKFKDKQEDCRKSTSKACLAKKAEEDAAAALLKNKATKAQLAATGQKIVNQSAQIMNAAKTAGIPYDELADLWAQMGATNKKAKTTSPDIVIPPDAPGGGDADAEGGFPWLLLLAAGAAATGAVPVGVAVGVGALAMFMGKKDEEEA